MKLIIDCGSSKADWLLLEGTNIIEKTTTKGFNPNYTQKNNISSITLNDTFYLPYIQYITHVYFYGSGCGNNKNCELIRDIIASKFLNSKIEVYSDIMAACHALFYDKKGIVGILGTGSNSCLYNNGKILQKATSLGYILGDEGSGCHIAKQLIRDYFYKKMPKNIEEEFRIRYNIDSNELINNIYSGHNSRYIASFTPFAKENIDNEYIRELCSRSFNDFIDNFILCYENDDNYQYGIVGSIAFYFEELVRECLKRKGINEVKIIKSPIDELIHYHSLQR